MVSKKFLTTSLCFILLVVIVGTTATGFTSSYSTPEMNLNAIPLEDSQGELINSTETMSVLEIDAEEGSVPVYVLVFVDEEERACPWWKDRAKKQIERGDTALLEYFGIDLRILDFLNWDSDDSKHSMYDLLYELEDETKIYLDQLYVGEYWTDYVDAVFGITSQRITDAQGCAFINGRFAVWQWQQSGGYWKDNNIVQHEVAHLFGAFDHDDGCCAMATGHEHFVTWILEDGVYLIMDNILCCYITSKWCPTCSNAIQANIGKFSSNPSNGDGALGGEEVPINIPLEQPFPVPVIIIIVVSASVWIYLILRARKKNKANELQSKKM